MDCQRNARARTGFRCSTETQRPRQAAKPPNVPLCGGRSGLTLVRYDLLADAQQASNYVSHFCDVTQKKKGGVVSIAQNFVVQRHF
jgi:hypothetical protein